MQNFTRRFRGNVGKGGHLHEGAGDSNPLIFVVMGKFAGSAGYHEPAAQDARRRIVSFFRTHLT